MVAHDPVVGFVFDWLNAEKLPVKPPARLQVGYL
jgi:hypothetical protein